jgi:hypothetical protein
VHYQNHPILTILLERASVGRAASFFGGGGNALSCPLKEAKAAAACWVDG